MIADVIEFVIDGVFDWLIWDRLFGGVVSNVSKNSGLASCAPDTIGIWNAPRKADVSQKSASAQ